MTSEGRVGMVSSNFHSLHFRFILFPVFLGPDLHGLLLPGFLVMPLISCVVWVKLHDLSKTLLLYMWTLLLPGVYFGRIIQDA